MTGNPVTSTGITVRYASDAVAPDHTLINDTVYDDCHLTDKIVQGVTTANSTVTGGGGTITANLYGKSTNMATILPALTPSLDWNISYTINAQSSTANPSYVIQYTHDCFPGFEAYIGTQRVYGYLPQFDNPGLISGCLAGFSQKQGLTTGIVR